MVSCNNCTAGRTYDGETCLVCGGTGEVRGLTPEERQAFMPVITGLVTGAFIWFQYNNEAAAFIVGLTVLCVAMTKIGRIVAGIAWIILIVLFMHAVISSR